MFILTTEVLDGKHLTLNISTWVLNPVYPLNNWRSERTLLFQRSYEPLSHIG